MVLTLWKIYCQTYIIFLQLILLTSPGFSVGFVDDQVSVSESEGSVTLNIVSTPAARPVEITVITQDIIGGVRPATADAGKIFYPFWSPYNNIQPSTLLSYS